MQRIFMYDFMYNVKNLVTTFFFTEIKLWQKAVYFYCVLLQLTDYRKAFRRHSNAFERKKQIAKKDKFYMNKFTFIKMKHSWVFCNPHCKDCKDAGQVLVHVPHAHTAPMNGGAVHHCHSITIQQVSHPLFPGPAAGVSLSKGK